MLIEVKKDILDAAISSNDNHKNEAVSFLSELSLTVKRGKHIVYVPDLKDNIDMSIALSKVIGKNAVALLKSSQRNMSKFHALTNRLNTKAVCSYSSLEDEEGWERIIHINPLDMSSFEVSTETFVIGENLSDTILFDIILNYYKSTINQISVDRCYYSLMGGGDTTYLVYENECINQHHFCLVITDSDFQLPCAQGQEMNSFSEDSTAKKVLNIHLKYKPRVAVFYPMRFVSEIENLIPKDILVKLSANQKQKIVLEHDYSYYDLKRGLDYNRLWNIDQSIYWKKIYSTDVDFSDFDTLKESNPSFESFKKANNGKKILPGWSNDILKKILSNPVLVKQLNRIVRSQLSESQNKEWINIGNLMFNWTCSLGPRYS